MFGEGPEAIAFSGICSLVPRQIWQKIGSRCELQDLKRRGTRDISVLCCEVHSPAFDEKLAARTLCLLATQRWTLGMSFSPGQPSSNDPVITSECLRCFV